MSQYGVDFTEELLKHLNRKGPISLRVNLVANDGDEFREVTNIVERDEIVASFKRVPFESEEDSSLAFTVNDAYRISPERDPHWLRGRYEIQDLGSQFISELLSLAVKATEFSTFVAETEVKRLRSRQKVRL